MTSETTFTVFFTMPGYCSSTVVYATDKDSAAMKVSRTRPAAVVTGVMKGVV